MPTAAAAVSTTETPPHIEVMDLPPTISILLTPGGTVATAAEELQTTRTEEDLEYEYNSLTLDEMDDIKDLEGGDYLNDATWESLDTELVNKTE